MTYDESKEYLKSLEIQAEEDADSARKEFTNLLINLGMMFPPLIEDDDTPFE